MKVLSALKQADSLLREMQAVVARYLPPDSGIGEHEALSQLIGLLDGPRQREVQESIGRILE